MRSFIATVSLVSLFLTACGHDEPARSGTITSLTQVVYPADPDPLPHLVLTAESVVCPQDVCVLKDPPVPIVIPLRDGAIIGGRSDVIQRVGPDGRIRFAFGSIGDGPGEYRMTTGGDVDSNGMLTVMDMRMSPRRLQYDSTGKALSTVAVSLPQNGEALITLFVRGHDVYFLTTHNPVSPSDSNNAKLDRLSEDGRSFKTVLRLHCSQPTTASGMGFPLSFVWRFPAVAVDDNGDIYSAQPDSYKVEKSTNGAVSFRLAMDVVPDEVTTKDIEAYRGPMRPVAHGSDKLSMQVNTEFEKQHLAAAANAPKVFPVLSTLTVLSDNSIWIRRYSRKGADSVRWDAFKADGKPIGSVTLATIAQIRAGTASRILMVDKDSLDVPIIRWYAVGVSPK